MSTTNLSKLDYLKKYMNKDDKKSDNKLRKKKKKIKKSYGNNIKIIDNDISVRNLQEYGSGDEFALEEEKPLIYAEGGTLLKNEYEKLKESKEMRWKTLIETKPEVKRKVQRHDSDSDSDVSIPRGRLQSTQNKRHGSDSDSDLSVKRKHKRHDSSSSGDLSPLRTNQRRNSSDSDMSPVRRKTTKESDSDLSPERTRKNYDEDFSPPRNKKGKIEKTHRREHAPEVVKEGKKSGLQTGAELREENALKKQRERELFKNMDKSISGKDAKTIVRDRKTGKEVDLKLKELERKKKEGKILEEKEKYARWGKGLKQEENYNEKLISDLQEMEKPLARYKDDTDLDNMLKKADREGDPMLAYLTKKKTSQKKVSKPKYNGPTPPPNRFNIWPGYRYDGVDRSNGFEKKRFLEISNRKSLKQDAYKWSIEDM